MRFENRASRITLLSRAAMPFVAGLTAAFFVVAAALSRAPWFVALAVLVGLPLSAVIFWLGWYTVPLCALTVDAAQARVTLAWAKGTRTIAARELTRARLTGTELVLRVAAPRGEWLGRQYDIVVAENDVKRLVDALSALGMEPKRR